MNQNNSKIIFECLGFFSTPVYYRFEDGFLYHFGYYDEIKKFEYYSGYLSRNKNIPNDLPTKEQVEVEYKQQLQSKGVSINSEIVLAG